MVEHVESFDAREHIQAFVEAKDAAHLGIEGNGVRAVECVPGGVSVN